MSTKSVPGTKAAPLKVELPIEFRLCRAVKIEMPRGAVKTDGLVLKAPGPIKGREGKALSTTKTIWSFVEFTVLSNSPMSRAAIARISFAACRVVELLKERLPF